MTLYTPSFEQEFWFKEINGMNDEAIDDLLTNMEYASIPMNMGFRMEDEPEDDDYFIPNGIEWQETMYKFNIEKESKIEKFKSDTTKSQFCS
jgi:hypothetical protein